MGRPVFLSKDDTPGCTTEACEFRDNIFAYKDFNAQILGVSLDDIESHKEFAEESRPAISVACRRRGSTLNCLWRQNAHVRHDRRQTPDIYHWP